MSLYVLERADPRHISVNITSASGRVYRWGDDEKDAKDVPTGLSISTQIPGGFATLDCALRRRPDLTYQDLDRFAPCTATSKGGGLVAFDGYLSSSPLSRTDSYSIAPEAIGWSGALKDNPGFSMVYIDRRLSVWKGPSRAREITLIDNGFQLGSITSQVIIDQSGDPSLQLSGAWPWSGNQICEVLYDGGAMNRIAFVQWKSITQVGGGGATYGLNTTSSANSDDLQAYTATTDAITITSTLIGNLSGSQGAAREQFASAYRFASFDLINSGSTGNSPTFGTVPAGNPPLGVVLSNLAVIGDHGLTSRTGPSGTNPGADDGFYGGDIIAHIVSTGAPELSVARGTGGIYNDTFVVPQAAFNQPVTPDTAVQQINSYYLYDYGVYENKQFFWQPPGSGREWHARVGEGVKLQDQGPQIETAFNGVIVQFTDASGTARFVGPPATGLPSYSSSTVTADASSSALVDTSSTNPVNAYGRTRWALVQMGTTTTGGAIQVGQLFLQTSGSRPTSGTAMVTGFARSSGQDFPCWMMRAGDTVVFDDTNDQTPRYILATAYDHDTLTNTLTLDAPPNKLDWILARLGLVISALS